MKIPICRLWYHRYGISALTNFSNGVKNGIFTNVIVFTTPPITGADFSVVQAAFITAAADFVQYGITKQTAFLNAKADLIAMLDTVAAYVNTVANGDVSIIALAGFTPTSDELQPALPLGRIEGVTVSLSPTTGELIVDIRAYANQRNVNYNAICVEGVPLTNPTILNGQLVLHPDDPMVRQDFNKNRHKVFSGLTPGVKYYIYVFATNNAGVSPLSNPLSIYAS